MPRNPLLTRPQKKDIALLWDLYRCRVLTTDQIKRMYFSSSKSYVNQKLLSLRNSKFISTDSFPRPNRKGFAYHSITDKGIKLLKSYGYDVPHGSDSLRVRHQFLPYVFETNEIMIHLTPFGWHMKDSREVKREFNLNRGDQIHGSLTSPEGTEYGFFVLESATTEKNMLKTIREIRALTDRNSKEKTLTNFIIFTKGQDSIDHFIERANTEKVDHTSKVVQEKLRPRDALCVMHMKVGLDYLKSKLSNKTYFENVFKQDKAPAHWIALSDKNRFECITKYNGNEVYVVNMLDTDLTKVDAIENYLGDLYRMERFGERIRNLLIITEPRLEAFHTRLIGQNPYIEYLSLNHKQIESSNRPKKEMKQCDHHIPFPKNN